MDPKLIKKIILVLIIFMRQSVIDYWNNFEPPRAIRLTDITNNDTVMIIDMQEDFVFPTGTMPTDGALDLLPNIIKLIDHACYNEISLFLTRDYHPLNHCSFLSNNGTFPTHCVQSSQGSKIVPIIADTINNYVVINQKHQHIMVLFKGFYPTMDSYGCFDYQKAYANDRDLNHNHIKDDNDVELTGSFLLHLPNLIKLDETGLISEFDINSDPIQINPIPLAQLIKCNRNLYIAGLVFDYCVLDSAITARCQHKFDDIYIMIDMTLPFSYKSEIAIKLLELYNIKLAHL